MKELIETLNSAGPWVERLGIPFFIIVVFGVAIRAVWKAMLPRFDEWKKAELAVLASTHKVMQDNSSAGLEISRNNSLTLSGLAESQKGVVFVLTKLADRIEDIATSPVLALDSDEAKLFTNLRLEQRLSRRSLKQLSDANVAQHTHEANESSQP